ncbi:MAG: hypothetical protein K1Y36_29305 [Blastocatellia bacterium]|nr:hypothetical protein [Blastocatellia bacterium]
MKSCSFHSLESRLKAELQTAARRRNSKPPPEGGTPNRRLKAELKTAA